MNTKEYLTWILDRPQSEYDSIKKTLLPKAYQTRQQHFDDKIQENKEFVRSLGQKCDAVGWSSFELTAPGGGELLEKIETFCRDGGWLPGGTIAGRLKPWKAIGTRSIRPLPK